MPDILQNNGLVLIIGFALAGGGVLSWVHLSRQDYVPRTAGYVARLFIRLAILFTVLWLACEWLNVSATFVALLTVFALIMAATGNVLGLGATVGLWVLQQYVLGFPDRREIILQPDASGSSAADIPEDLIGRSGVAVSALRPTGNVEIDGRTYDAVTEDGDFIDRRASVIVRQVSSTRVVVERNG